MSYSKDEFVHDLFQNLAIGIGEVSKVVGVSPRQLRYWEQKGYIKPVEDEKSCVRRYNLGTVYLIAFIKYQLDKGYTLSAAYNSSKDIRVKSKIIRKFIQNQFGDIEITNHDHAYGKISLGNVKDKDGKNHKVKGIIDEKGNRFVIEDK